jgi:hypothetical protein
MFKRACLLSLATMAITTGATADEQLSLLCSPQFSSSVDGANPITKIEVAAQGTNMTVTHIAANGARYDRSMQYLMRVLSNSILPAWQGPNIKLPHLSMLGKVTRGVDGSLGYSEQLFDANAGGAKTFEMRASCIDRKPSLRAAAQAPQPAAPTVTAPPPRSGCQAVSDPGERLKCYDLQFPPVQQTAKAEPKPAPIEALAPDTPAPPPSTANSGSDKKYLSDSDLEEMHETYEKNQARFVRDFVGRPFRATLTVNKVTQNPIFASQFHVSFGTAFHGVSCGIEDQRVIAFITNLNKGDRVFVVGNVSDHSFGDVDLKNCEISSAH